MSLWMEVVLCGVGSYLLGSVPFALLLGKLKGIDVRTIGSGNVGAMNLGRVLGRSWFFAVFGLDLVKGLVPSLVAGWVLTSGADGSASFSPAWRDLCRLAVGVLAVVGHNYPIYIGFRGGKGVSTSLGVALGVYPELTVPAVACFFVWAAGLGLTRMSSVGSITGAVLFPVFYFVWSRWRGESLPDRWPFLTFTIAIAIMVLWRHRANIARILAGTETKVIGSGEAARSSP